MYVFRWKIRFGNSDKMSSGCVFLYVIKEIKFNPERSNFYKLDLDTSSKARNPSQNQLNVENRSLSRQLGVGSPRICGGGGGNRTKNKSFQHFLNKVTVLAALKLTGSEFQVEGAATAKVLDPHFVR